MNEHITKGGPQGLATELEAASHQAQDVMGDMEAKMHSELTQAGEQATEMVDKVTHSVTDVLERVDVGVRKAIQSIAPVIKERPYTALAISAVVGLVAGLLMTNRGAKTVYLRQPS